MFFGVIQSMPTDFTHVPQDYIPGILSRLPLASETILRNVDIYGLMQGRRNPIANALELRLPCTNPSIWYINHMSPLKTDTYNWNKSKQYKTIYCQTSNISHNLVGNVIVDLSDVVGASPVGAAPTTSSFST